MTPNSPEKKTPHRCAVFQKCHDHFVRLPIPAVNWLWCLGACLIVALGFMGLSGLFLAINYQPDIQHAFSSVMTMERRIPAGWFIRALHMGGATMLFAALYLHIGRGLWYGSYKAPRELVWLSGLCLMILFMSTAFAGYILPWGQMSYWGATVATHALGSIPFIGKPLVTLLLGGTELGNIALRRFFVFHFAIGFIAVALVMIHVLCLHSVGSTNPTKESPEPDFSVRPFHPFYTIKDAIAVCLFLILYAVLIFFLPQLIEKQANLFPANAFKTPPAISPEWYLSPYFAMVRAVPSQLGGLLTAIGSVLLLCALPWLDRSPRHNARYRPLVRVGWLLFFTSFIILTIAGLLPPSPLWIGLSRFALIIWFGVLLILLPYTSQRERHKSQKEMPE